MKKLGSILPVFSRGLPKTGQETSYLSGDDGDYEAGWWIKRLYSNNLQRFVDKTIGGDTVVIDRATGLMWPKDMAGSGCMGGGSDEWSGGIGFSNSLTFAGFSDWRLPNIIELFSITDFRRTGIFLVQGVFDNEKDEAYWSSTTHIGVTTDAFLIDRSTAELMHAAKTNFLYCHPCRGGV